MARRRRHRTHRRNPGRAREAVPLVAGVVGVAAPFVSRFALGGPLLPVAGAAVLTGLAWEKFGKGDAARQGGHGLFLGGLAGLGFSLLYNLRNSASQIVAAKNPDTLRGVG